MHLQTNVVREHVEEAHRIFKISTLNAAASGMSMGAKDTPPELQGKVKQIEDAIKRRVAIGTRIGYPKLHEELLNRFDNARAIDFAILSMVKRDELVHHEARKILERKR
jgi:DNA replication licensing factor MCM5